MRDVAPSGRAKLSRQAHRAVSVIPAQQTFRSDRSDGRMALPDRLLTIFDVEGTLVDSTALTLRCWQQTLRSFGFELAIAELQPHSGRDPKDMLNALLRDAASAVLVAQLIEAQGRRYRKDCLPAVKAFPGVRRLFERLKEERRLIALATSCSPDELAHYQKLADIGDLIDAAACGADVDHDKPDPSVIEIALVRAGPIPAGDAVMVGDSPYDAQAARGAGMPAIGLLSGGFSKAELEANGCVAVYRDPADMLTRNFASDRLPASRPRAW